MNVPLLHYLKLSLSLREMWSIFGVDKKKSCFLVKKLSYESTLNLYEKCHSEFLIRLFVFGDYVGASF